ncbi:MAG: PAS domain S-box protein [Chloroflexi bacterium]|nr:PAS domain S-box protein [Chloroflexota bacterium]
MRNFFRRFLTTSVFENEEKTRAAQIINSIGWVALTAVLALLLARIFTLGALSGTLLIFFPAVLFSILAAQVLVCLGRVQAAGVLLVVCVWIALTFQASRSNGLRDVATFAYPIIILLAALLLGRRAGVLIGLLSIAAIWMFAYQETEGVKPHTADPPYYYALDLTIILILSSALVYILIHRLNRSLSDAKLELNERLRVEEKLHQQTRYLTTLHETTFGLLNRLELKPLLESILNHTSELFETPHAGIDLVLPDGSALKQEMGYGIYEGWNGALTQKGVGLTGKVWEQGKTILVNDYEAWEGKNPEAAEIGLYAVAGAPLKSGGSILGVLLVSTIEKGRRISSEQVTLLERLAALASLAIDNARLYEEAQTEIRERKIVEQNLRASEERFRKVFNNSNIAITIVTLEEGAFLEANDAFWRLSGLTPEQALGHTSIELGMWDNPQERAEFLQKLLEHGHLRNVEVVFKNKKTGAADLPTIAYYEMIQIKDQRCLLCMFYDISEQRKAERALRESEERFRKVFQSNPVAICITTLEEGRLLDANPAYWKLTGYEPETSLGKTVTELDMGDTPELRREFVNDLREKHSILNPNYEFYDARSKKKLHAIALYELFELNNQNCILTILYDITEQKLAENAVKSAEARMRAIIASIPDMIFEVAKNGEFLDFMASANLVPIMEPHEFIGKNLKQLFPPAIAEQTIFALDRALTSGQVHAFEYGLPPGEEIQFFEARVAPVTAQSAIIMVRDISQRKWVETEREKLIEELENKNAELERFTYTVSHDLKSPIITIRGFLGFLEQDALSGNISRLRGDIKRIADATEKMQTLLNELLELSRIGRLVNPAAQVPFNAIVEEAISIVQGRLQNANIQVNIQSAMPSVYVDRPRMVEALQNLIDNAAKFVKTDPRIEVGQQGLDGEMPIFYVRDNGIGIDPIHHERIFGLFNKLDADSEGTGVGLALVKRIIEVHKGRIWVQSEPGKGATFFFTLPTKPLPDS